MHDRFLAHMFFQKKSEVTWYFLNFEMTKCTGNGGPEESRFY